jgi:hypothetical protein
MPLSYPTLFPLPPLTCGMGPHVRVIFNLGVFSWVEVFGGGQRCCLDHRCGPLRAVLVGRSPPLAYEERVLLKTFLTRFRATIPLTSDLLVIYLGSG